jgi:hypothetical protein
MPIKRKLSSGTPSLKSMKYEQSGTNVEFKYELVFLQCVSLKWGVSFSLLIIIRLKMKYFRPGMQVTRKLLDVEL